MTSCWLGNYAEAQDSLVYVPTETVYFGTQNTHNRKNIQGHCIRNAICIGSTCTQFRVHAQLRISNICDIFDESYDTETDDIVRVEKVARLLKDLDNQSERERQQYIVLVYLL
jgi:hypothetical protein